MEKIPEEYKYETPYWIKKLAELLIKEENKQKKKLLKKTS